MSGPKWSASSSSTKASDCAASCSSKNLNVSLLNVCPPPFSSYLRKIGLASLTTAQIVSKLLNKNTVPRFFPGNILATFSSSACTANLKRSKLLSSCPSPMNPSDSPLAIEPPPLSAIMEAANSAYLLAT